MNTPAQIVRRALYLSDLNQDDFSKKLGKSQSQISKYLNNKSLPTANTLMHCMNIIKENEEKGPIESPHDVLLRKVKKLEGCQHSHICEALLGVINLFDKDSINTN